MNPSSSSYVLVTIFLTLTRRFPLLLFPFVLACGFSGEGVLFSFSFFTTTGSLTSSVSIEVEAPSSSDEESQICMRRDRDALGSNFIFFFVCVASFFTLDFASSFESEKSNYFFKKDRVMDPFNGYSPLVFACGRFCVLFGTDLLESLESSILTFSIFEAVSAIAFAVLGLAALGLAALDADGFEKNDAIPGGAFDGFAEVSFFGLWAFGLFFSSLILTSFDSVLVSFVESGLASTAPNKDGFFGGSASFFTTFSDGGITIGFTLTSRFVLSSFKVMLFWEMKWSISEMQLNVRSKCAYNLFVDGSVRFKLLPFSLAISMLYSVREWLGQIFSTFGNLFSLTICWWKRIQNWMSKIRNLT